MFGWEMPPALRASCRKRSTNFSSSAYCSRRIFEGHVPVQHLVVGEVDFGHTPTAEKFDQGVTVVYDGVHDTVRTPRRAGR
jgi:hypothetical protein